MSLISSVRYTMTRLNRVVLQELLLSMFSTSRILNIITISKFRLLTTVRPLRPLDIMVEGELRAKSPATCQLHNDQPSNVIVSQGERFPMPDGLCALRTTPHFRLIPLLAWPCPRGRWLSSEFISMGAGHTSMIISRQIAKF